MQRQFQAVQNALNLSLEDVKKFAAACGLRVGYAMNAVGRMPTVAVPTTDPSRATGLRDLAVDLGSKFVTLADCCSYQITKAARFLEYLREIKDMITRLGIYPSNKEVTETMNKWMGIFQGLKPNEPVSEEIRDRLQAEIEPWKAACKDAMG
jgi:hypothetical protein